MQYINFVAGLPDVHPICCGQEVISLTATPGVIELIQVAHRSVDPETSRRMRVRFHLLRSEEHTSELQSLMRTSYAVFCLKKKNTLTINNIYKHHIRTIQDTY